MGVPTQQPPWIRFIKEITAIDIQEGVTGIGCLSFMLCQSVTEPVVIPEGVTYIEPAAFELSNITTFYLPKSIEFLDYSALITNQPLDIIYAGSEEDWNKITNVFMEQASYWVNSLTFCE